MFVLKHPGIGIGIGIGPGIGARAMDQGQGLGQALGLGLELVQGCDHFLRLHTPFSTVGLARWPYLDIAKHKTGRILIRSTLSSHSRDFVTVHGQAALSVFG